MSTIPTQVAKQPIEKEALSKFWETVRKADQRKSKSAARRAHRHRKESELDRRRSERLKVRVPVTVYGHAVDEEPFYEKTEAVKVNTHGGLIKLAKRVSPEQQLLLTNEVTQKEQKCRVVYLGSRRWRKSEVGITFLRADPEFW